MTDPRIDDESCTACGIDGSRGGPLYNPPCLEDHLSSESARRTGESDPCKAFGIGRHSGPHLGGEADGDPRDLSSQGWAAIFPANAQPEVREALAPLFEHRQAEAASREERRFRIFEGPDGYQPGDGRLDFLARQGVGPGTENHDLMPEHLLLVGGPEEIPWGFQFDLGLGYSVGRLGFETPAEYARYAARVVATESGQRQARAKKAIFFAPRHAGDRASELICEYLAGPLATTLETHAPDWTIERIVGEGAHRDLLASQLAGDGQTSLLFAASHGVGYPCGDPRQRDFQGSLLCAESPGPKAWREPVPNEHIFSADAIGDEATPPDVCFLFACHGAGTPRTGSYPEPGKERPNLAPEPFAAKIPQRLLGLHNGALAVVGHVERSYCYSFVWPGAGGQIGVFESALKGLLDGLPVGVAFRSFPERYAELATSLAEALENNDFGAPLDPAKLARLWTARTDARGYVILGDPAVRLRPQA
ncbi:MAG TPA: hypothetical protein VN851_01685 [Thermoanaerobaculia bacterium]|nr:hypothetical protein [Thermoanaerobaculia bacterium]